MNDYRNSEHYRQGYVAGKADTRILSEPVIQSMYEDLGAIIDRETVEPDHPDNIHENEIAFLAGRFDAYSEYFALSHINQ